MNKTVVLDGELCLTLCGCAELSLELVEDGEFGAITVIRDATLPTYMGETIVTPKAFASTTLETAHKSVYDDIHVLEIPYNEVSNESGGYTVSIG